MKPDEALPTCIVTPDFRYTGMLGTGSISSTSKIVLNITLLYLSLMYIWVVAYGSLVHPALARVVVLCC